MKTLFIGIGLSLLAAPALAQAPAAPYPAPGEGGMSANPANDTRQIDSAAAAQLRREQQLEHMGATAAPGGATAPSMATGSAPGMFAGQMVNDTAGDPVGRIQSVEGDYVVLETSAAKVRMPKTSFATRDGKLVITMTEAQVNAAAGATRQP